jgi:hypothetical protein
VRRCWPEEYQQAWATYTNRSEGAAALQRKVVELSRSAAVAVEDGDEAASWRAEAARLRDRLRSVEAGAEASVAQCAQLAAERVRVAEYKKRSPDPAALLPSC